MTEAFFVGGPEDGRVGMIPSGVAEWRVAERSSAGEMALAYQPLPTTTPRVGLYRRTLLARGRIVVWLWYGWSSYRAV